MVKELLSYKRGSLRIRVTGGSYDRFLNLCANHGIALWNLEYADGGYEMDISLTGFRMLRPLARKSSSKVRILRRRGLPFFLHRYRKRKMLFAGMAFGLFVMITLSRFLWSIDIEGNEKITDGQILHYLEEVQISAGTRLSKIDCKDLAAKLRRQFEDFTWVAVSQDGTSLSIQVQENTDFSYVRETVKDTAPADLVADKNGTIVSIITRKGVPLVAKGDKVKKGDVLVKGVLDIVDDSGEVKGHQYCHSDADIQIKTTYQYKEKIPVTKVEKKYTGRKKTEYYVRIGNQYLAIPSGNLPFSQYDTIRDIRQLCLFQNFYLPFSLVIQEHLEYENVKVKRDETTVVGEAEKNLYKFFTKIQEKGVQIFKNNVKIETNEKYCMAKGTLILIENAGKSVERTTLE